jgi:hypothetical protein
MSEFSRRVFLTRSSIVVAAAGVATSIPNLTSALAAGETEAPAAEAAVADGASTMSEPLIAHVRDLATGEIGLFSGEREVVFHDPTLATRLFNASR